MKKNKKINKTKKDKKKLSRAKKLALWLFLLILVLGLAFLAINAYVKASVSARVLSPEQIADLDADCIIVLGAGVKEDGRPSHMLEDRLICAIDVYSRGASDKVLMSGDHGREEYDEVNTMKAFAIARGIPSENIFMDHAGFSTYETMYRARDIFCTKKVIVITQGYHLYRALYIAKELGLDAYGVAADLRTYRGQAYFDLREMIARVKDFFTVIIRPGPTYLGEAIPISGNGDVTNDRKGGI